MSNYFLILRTVGRQAVNANWKFSTQLWFFSCIMLARAFFPDYCLPDFFIHVMTTSYRFKLAIVELDKGYFLNSCHFKLQLWYIVLRSSRTSRCKMIFRRTLVVFSRRRISPLTFLRVLCLQTKLSDFKMIGVFTRKIIFQVGNLRRVSVQIQQVNRELKQTRRRRKRKCHFAFLQSVFSYSKSLCLKNVY